MSDRWNPIDGPIRDRVTIDGTPLPGTSWPTRVSDEREYAVNASYGQVGGAVRFRAKPPIKFDVVVNLWLPEHFDELDRQRANLYALPSKGINQSASLTDAIGAGVSAPGAGIPISRGHAIEHPLLTIAGISQCVFSAIEGPFPSDDTGAWQLTLRCIEISAARYRPAPKVAATPATPADQQNPYKKQLDENAERIETMLKRLSGSRP